MTMQQPPTGCRLLRMGPPWPRWKTPRSSTIRRLRIGWQGILYVLSHDSFNHVGFLLDTNYSDSVSQWMLAWLDLIWSRLSLLGIAGEPAHTGGQRTS